MEDVWTPAMVFDIKWVVTCAGEKLVGRSPDVLR